jgi:hypothetical protein
MELDPGHCRNSFARSRLEKNYHQPTFQGRWTHLLKDPGSGGMLPSAISILDTYKFNRIPHFTRQESSHGLCHSKKRSGNIDPSFDVVLPSVPL